MRPLTRVCLFLLTATVAACWLFEAAESCGVCLFPDLRAQADAVALFRQQRNDFVPRVADIVERLGGGRLNLREAVQVFCRDAAEHHPKYLKFLNAVNEFDSLEIKAAHQLLDNLFRHSASNAIDPEWADQLEREFESMLAN